MTNIVRKDATIDWQHLRSLVLYTSNSVSLDMQDGEYHDNSTYYSDSDNVSDTPSRALTRSSEKTRQLRPRKQLTSSPRTASSSSRRQVRKRPKDTDLRARHYRETRRSEGSLLGDVAYDVVWRLPRALYYYLKYFILAYILLWITLRALAFGYQKVSQALEPICNVPGISSIISLCNVDPAITKVLDPAKVVASQEQLDQVMNPAGDNRDLARNMMGHEYAVRDLRIRVAASDLKRKKELEDQFDSLIRRTKNTARGLSKFFAKVGVTVDAVITIDEHLVKTLSATEERKSNPPTFAQKAGQALNPLAAFRPSSSALSEQEVKSQFLQTTNRLADELRPLLLEAFDLHNDLDSIQETLDQIQKLAVHELGDLPRKDVLAKLWSEVRPDDDYVQYKSHKQLLGDLTSFYKAAGEVMQETYARLHRAESDVEAFRDEYAIPGLTLKDEPLAIIIGKIQNSAKRLEAGRRSMAGREVGAE